MEKCQIWKVFICLQNKDNLVQEIKVFFFFLQFLFLDMIIIVFFT